MQIPRIMIAAPSSNSGKTFITCGVLRLLQQEGLSVNAFKCGPDFIDPMFHKRVLKTPSRNLDTFFTKPELTRALFSESVDRCDVAVVEGVMGYFDGMSVSSFQASSYELADVTDTPVILVMDVAGMSRSVIPVLKGLCEYGENHLIRGVILNKASQRIYPELKAKIEEEIGIEVLGYLPKIRDSVWKSRHLGLYLPDEVADLQKQIDQLVQTMKQTINVSKMLEIARSAKELHVDKMTDIIKISEVKEEQIRKTPVRIGVAQDEAFCFYYEDNLNLLKRLGAEIVPFSPLLDQKLPQVDGLLLGGGYPELYGEQLEDNQAIREDIKRAAVDNMPILAECGGYMYLQQKMTDMSGKSWKMAGAIEGESYPTSKLVRFGYIELWKQGEKMPLKGHEFHYFDSTNTGDTYKAIKPVRGTTWNCMVQSKNILAGFPHLYYYAQPEFAEKFVQKCREYRQMRQKGVSV